MNHLALVAPDVRALQRFYCTYFGFSEIGRGPGFLEGRGGFLLTIDEIEGPPVVPAWLHHGFFLASKAEILALYEQMKRDGVTIASDPEQMGPTFGFFCRDPAGFLIEVRAPDPPPATGGV